MFPLRLFLTLSNALEISKKTPLTSTDGLSLYNTYISCFILNSCGVKENQLEENQTELSSNNTYISCFILSSCEEQENQLEENQTDKM